MRTKTTHFLATTVVLAVALIVGPLAVGGPWGGAAVSLAWVWATAASVQWGDARPGVKRIARWLAGVVAVIELISLWHVGIVQMSALGTLLSAIQTVSSEVLLVLAVLSLFRHLFRARRVTTEQILASVTLMLLLGVLFWVVYLFLDRLSLAPEAFTGLTTEAGPATALSSERAGELMYFSFVTLTTLGYGDITPLHPVARSLVAIEALTGQLYIAVLVARLVALHIMHSGARDAPGSDAGRS